MAEIKRPNYFHSQFLQAEDFQAEQNYHIFMRRHLNRVLHDWGVVLGLEVAAGTGKQVNVSPGTALDVQGREIIVPEGLPQTVNLSNYGEGEQAYIAIGFNDVKDDDDRYQSGGVDNFTRITERPAITASSTPPADSGETIILATVTLAASGIASIDSSVRRQASSVKQSAKIQGSLEVTDALDIHGALTVNDSTIINDNATVNGRLAVKGKIHSTHSSSATPVSNALEISSSLNIHDEHIIYAGRFMIDGGAGKRRFAIFASALGGQEAEAGHFEGNVVINGNLSVSGPSLLQQEDWHDISLINQWKRYSNTYNPPQYFKDTFGVVHLRGLVKDGSSETIGFLPKGFHPSYREIHIVATRFEEDARVGGYTGKHPHNGFGRVDIYTDGEIYMSRGSKGWICLDGITFRTV